MWARVCVWAIDKTPSFRAGTLPLQAHFPRYRLRFPTSLLTNQMGKPRLQREDDILCTHTALDGGGEGLVIDSASRRI